MRRVTSGDAMLVARATMYEHGAMRHTFGARTVTIHSVGGQKRGD